MKQARWWLPLYFSCVAWCVATPLTLDDLHQSIDLHFPLIRAALEDQKKAEADALSAQGGFDPVLRTTATWIPTGEYTYQWLDVKLAQPTGLWGTTFYTGYQLGTGNIPSYYGERTTNSSGEWSLGAEIPLLQNGPIDRRRTQIALTGAQTGVAKLSLESQRLETRRQGYTRFIDWVAAYERLRIAQEVLQLAVDRDHITQTRVKRGDAARMEQVDNQRNVAQRRALLVSAERAFQKACLELSLYLRDSDGKPRALEREHVPNDHLSLESNPELPATSDQTNPDFPDLLRIGRQMDMASIELQWAQNLLLPKLNAFTEFSQDLGAGSASRALPEFRVGLTLEWPLWLRSARGQTAAIQATRAKLDAQRELAQQRLNVSLVDAQQMIRAARERILQAHDEIRLAREVETAERLRLKHGDSNILFVNLRELATAEAKTRLIEAKADFEKSKLDLEILRTKSLPADDRI